MSVLTWNSLRNAYQTKGSPAGFAQFCAKEGHPPGVELNTCAARLSAAIFAVDRHWFDNIKIDYPVPHSWGKFVTYSDAMAIALTQKLGKAVRIRDHRDPGRKRPEGKGIVFFDKLSGWSRKEGEKPKSGEPRNTGHISLWDGSIVVDVPQMDDPGNNYWNRANLVYFWKLPEV